MGLATLATTTDLTSDRVEFLRQTLGARFTSQPTFSLAIMSILDAIGDGWASNLGMAPDKFHLLNSALVSHFEALLVVPPDQAKYTIDQLAIAWNKVRSDARWL